MKKLSAVIFITASFLFSLYGFGQTDGTVTFSVRTVSNGGEYTPEHVLAIWLETSSGTFVRTFKVRAADRIQKLFTWKIASAFNTTDAITGATLTSHTTHSITWNCRNLSNVLVPDGNYRIRVEFTEDDFQGPVANYSFTKNNTSQTINFPDQTYFKDVVLTYNAITSVEKNDQISGMTVFPNPFYDNINLIAGNDGSREFSLQIFDSNGSLLYSQISKLAFTDKIVFTWNGTTNSGQKCTAGTYYYHIQSEKHNYYGKILRMQ